MDDLALSEHLMRRILEIFPEFESEWRADHPGGEAQQKTVHSVYMSLFPFVHSASHSPKQLAKFAALLNEAVAAGGNADNAVGTCFLEHFGQSPLRKAIWPLLLPATKQRTRANR
ncbi:MAG: hypothetical protein AMXMBFR59_42480 [Rhodanobacteraceae bacterium]